MCDAGNCGLTDEMKNYTPLEVTMKYGDAKE